MSATHAALTRCFGYAFREPDPEEKVFRPHLIRRTIDGPFEIGGMKWEPIPLFHGDMPVLGFRVGRLAYCTDVNRIPDSSFELLKELDVLVLDALQHKRHATHFSLEEAVEAAGKIGAGRTYFTHIAHALGHDATNAMLPGNVRLRTTDCGSKFEDWAAGPRLPWAFGEFGVLTEGGRHTLASGAGQS